MTTEQSGPTRPTELDARTARRTLVERRRRVWRNVLAVFAATLLMLILLLLNRDKQAVEGCRRRMTNAVAVLQKLHDSGAPPPFNLPTDADGTPTAHTDGQYYYDAFFMTRSGPAEVGVCCCRRPHGGLFRSDGRFVIVYDTRGEKYSLRWVRESDFATQAEELGLRVPDLSQ